MIAVGEGLASAAEVPFFLPLATDPINSGLTGHDFTNNATTGEVQIMLPGGAWFNVAGSQIKEKAFGRYCVQLTSSQCASAGTVYIRAVISGGVAQPYTGTEVIGTSDGDVQVAGDGYFDFFLPNGTDPIYGAPITGHVFTLGDVQIWTPGASAYANAALVDISEIGFGAYRVHLHGTTTATRGKAFVYVDGQAFGSQRFEGYATILTGTSGGLTAPTISNITPAVGAVAGSPGAFSILFSQARITPITFDLASIPGGADVAVTVAYANRNETYVARHVDGVWTWPFDVAGDNVFTSTGPTSAHVSMLPRGGWPPTLIEFKVAASKKAVPL